jgi:hypothetical protein
MLPAHCRVNSSLASLVNDLFDRSTDRSDASGSVRRAMKLRETKNLDAIHYLGFRNMYI